MGISIQEFQKTMEILGAQRLNDRKGSRYDVFVPCFRINRTQFYHSGTYYVVNSGGEIPSKIMDCAMEAVGEKDPGGRNFWWGEVHSVKGMIVLATMMKGNYSKELVDELTNKVYKQILDNSLIKKNIEFETEFRTISPKMQKLYKLLKEHRNVVNPFGIEGVKIKEPVKYIDKLDIKFSKSEKNEGSYWLTLKNTSYETYLRNSPTGWCYRSEIYLQENQKSDFILLIHYYEKESSNTVEDEIIYLKYNMKKDVDTEAENEVEGVDLRFSLKTGLAWKTYKEKAAQPITDEQLDCIITNLKISIRYLKKNLICNMIETAE